MLRVAALTLCLLCVMIMAAAAWPNAGRVALAQPAEACDWTGTWLPFEGEWRFAQSESRVSGSYLDGKGYFSGTVDGATLRGEWKEPPSYSPPFDSGHLNVTISDDCRFFNGTWGLGPADCCNPLDAIRFEDAPPALAVQVERGTMVVDGQTIPAGDTYFPPHCPSDARSPDFCASFLLLGLAGEKTKVKMHCVVDRFLRVLSVVETVDLNTEETELLLELITIALLEKCGVSPPSRQNGGELGLAVREGAALITNAVADQTVSVEAGSATSLLAEPGSFIAGYDPTAARATFRTQAAPLEVQPQSASAFTLPPFSQVDVTETGPGLVTALDLVYLPMQNR